MIDQVMQDKRPPVDGSNTESVSGLVRQLADDVSTLLTTEVALAKAEVREAVDNARKGVVSMAGGIALLFGSVVILLIAASVALSNVIAAWAAYLIVGGIGLAVGLVMAKAGSAKVDPQAFVPERTIDAARKDKHAVKENIQ